MTTSQDFLNWVCGPELDPHYLKYVLMAEHETMSRFASGSVHQTIYFPEAKAFHICVPDLGTQEAIVALLKPLDDQIASAEALLTKLRLLGESYFASVAELGPRLADVAAVIPGQSPPGHLLNEEGVGLPFYQGNRDFGLWSPSPRVYCKEPNRTAQGGDVLFSVRAPVGDLNVASAACGIGRGVAAIRSEDAPSCLFYAVAASADEWSSYEGLGTVFGSITRKQLDETVIAWPHPSHLSKVEDFLALLEARRGNAERQMRKLHEMRDLMLPRLLRGQLITQGGVPT